ncbi:MAG TPA: hypothetical protein VFF40_04575 [Acidimicrobiia bacterium]|nr:hypothetical protein [Acidimicrobiia bacterium]
MHISSPLAHEALLTLARKLEAAAADEEPERVETAARRLLEDLIDHLRAEQPGLARLPPEEGAVLARGQQRLVNLTVEVADGAHARGQCRCDGLAQQLIAELGLQAEAERRGLAALTVTP